MDCALWRLHDQDDSIALRLRGSEYTIAKRDFEELCGLIAQLLSGAEEALSEDYRELRRVKPVAKATNQIDLKALGLI